MLEVEVKIKTEKSVISELEGLGFVKKSVVYEKDTYYNSRLLNLKDEDKALRIREYVELDRGDDKSSAAKYILNYKGPKVDNVSMTREETEFAVPTFEAGESVLNGLGFFAAGVVEKKRVYFIRNDITCCTDAVTGLGDFIEIEIIADEEQYEDAMSRISELLAKLGYSIEDTIRSSYLCMLQEKE